jgi:hypothetical protein
MRVTSSLWVSAYIRRCAAEAAPAMVVHHGDDTAGAIFIKVNALDGTAELFGPAPAGLEATAVDRAWVSVLQGAESAVEEYIARQLRFDSDLWVIEVEDRRRRHFLDESISRTVSQSRLT